MITSRGGTPRQPTMTASMANPFNAPYPVHPHFLYTLALYSLNTPINPPSQYTLLTLAFSQYILKTHPIIPPRLLYSLFCLWERFYVACMSLLYLFFLTISQPPMPPTQYNHHHHHHHHHHHQQSIPTHMDHVLWKWRVCHGINSRR